MKKKRNQYYGVVNKQNNILSGVFDNRLDAESWAKEMMDNDPYGFWEVVRGVEKIRIATGQNYSKNLILNYGG